MGIFFLECALKIALARSIFQPKMHHISFGSRALPGPAGGAYSSPQTPYSCIRRGLLLRERGRIARGKERERRRGRERQEEKSEGKGG